MPVRAEILFQMLNRGSILQKLSELVVEPGDSAFNSCPDNNLP
jgi:hypothetical protein